MKLGMTVLLVSLTKLSSFGLGNSKAISCSLGGSSPVQIHLTVTVLVSRMGNSIYSTFTFIPFLAFHLDTVEPHYLQHFWVPVTSSCVSGTSHSLSGPFRRAVQRSSAHTACLFPCLNFRFQTKHRPTTFPEHRL